MQLELVPKSISSANNVNLLENSGFELYNGNTNMPKSWERAGDFQVTVNSEGTVTNGSTTTNTKESDRSLRITGVPGESKGVYQTVPVYGNENDTYILSGWAYGYPINNTYHSELKYEIAAKVKYNCKDNDTGDVTEVSQYKSPAKFNTNVTGYQYASSSFSLKYKDPEKGKTYTPVSILVMPRYNTGENNVYFDHIQLIKDVASSFTYDSKGNVVSVSANAEQKSNMEYSGKDLTKHTDVLGNTSEYSYDGNHNLTLTVSPRKLNSKYVYDDNGNVIKTATINSAGTAKIKNEQVYYGANSEEGIVAGAYLKYSYDYHGNETKYEYSWKRGIPTETINADGVKTIYGYNDSQQNRLTSVKSDNTKVTYDYKKIDDIFTNQKNKITFSGTEDNSPKETYSFTYDSFGNIATTKVGSQVLSTNTYGENNGPVLSTQYGNGDVKSLGYTSTGSVSSIKKNSSKKYTWSYDTDGTYKTHTDYENDKKYIYSYDAIGRLIRTQIKDIDSGLSAGYIESGYDIRNNLTKVAFNIGGRTKIDSYIYKQSENITNSSSYTKDNLISRYKLSSERHHDYTYDTLNRLTKTTISLTNPVYINYKYHLSNYNTGDSTVYKTTQLSEEYLDDTAYRYTYDVLGNITGVEKAERASFGTDTATNNGYSAYKNYTYDDKSQLTESTLISEAPDNLVITTQNIYTYDSIGNILNKQKNVSSNENADVTTQTISYRYGKDSKNGWNNLLVGVDLNGDGSYNEAAEAISYDEIGNPTSYFGSELDWYGRELRKYETDGNVYSYTYDSDGLRGTKTVNGVKTEYMYADGLLRYEKRGATELYYRYDADGRLAAIHYYNGDEEKLYYATVNYFGDVVGLYNGSGNRVVSYEYDDWGNVVSLTDTSSVDIGTINPIRYRGYYYDSETDLYYLQSRYYDPKIGRFLNADSQLNQQDGPLGFNMFAYCCNNPINMSDPDGHLPKWAKKMIAAVAVVAVVAVVAAITVATAGAGTAAACVAIGAAKGAAIGFAAGAATGAATGAVTHRITTGSWKGAGNAALNSAADGALSGAITGAITGAASSSLKVLQAAKSWDSGTFKSGYQSMKYHYNKHVLSEGLTKGNNVFKYTQDAVGFANRNSSVLKYTYNYNYGNASWNSTYSTGQGGMFTSTGQILTFWYG